MKIGERVLSRGVLLATVLTAAALVGCQRQPEATSPPPPTSIAASGEPRSPGIEAEIQARVRATMTAQQPARPAEAQKPASQAGEKVAIRLKPNELRKKLLTTSIADELPPGFTAGGNQPFDLTADDRAFGAVAKVIMSIGGANGSGDFGEIKYTIFPDASAAESAYNMLSTRYSSRHLPNLGRPALVQNILGGTASSPQTYFTSIVLVDNVLVTTSRNGPFDQVTQEQRATAVTNSAIAYLRRVGR